MKTFCRGYSFVLCFTSHHKPKFWKEKSRKRFKKEWLRGENQPEWSERLKVFQKKKGGGIAQREGWRGHRGKEVVRCPQKKKKKTGKQWGREDKVRSKEGCRTEGFRWKTLGKEENETEGEAEGWEVDRQITTRLRRADSCESRIWYCGTDTQPETRTRAHTVCRRRQPYVCVCAHAHAQMQAHGGTYTCSHYPKEPHYTWNINGAKQSAKMEMGETEGRRKGETERGKA